MKPVDYKSSGVDIEAGENAVKAIKDRVRSTFNANVLSELGSFGGLYRLDKTAWENPILSPAQMEWAPSCSLPYAPKSMIQWARIW